MARTPEEIKKQLEELKILKEKAELEYKEALEAGFKKHEECCLDICDIVNQAISKLNTNIAKATKIKEKTISRSIERSLSKDIIIAESQVKELMTLKDELYAKHICDCKR